MRKKCFAVIIGFVTLLLLMPCITSSAHASEWEFECPQLQYYKTEGSSVTLSWEWRNPFVEADLEIYCLTTNKRYSAPEKQGSMRINNLPAGETLVFQWRSTAMIDGSWKYTSFSEPLSITVKEGWDVTYDAAGGANAPAKQEKKPGISLRLSSIQPTRTGYTFKGWATNMSDALKGIVTYMPGDTYSSDKRLQLFASWEKVSEEPVVKTYSIYYRSNGGIGGPATQTKEQGRTYYISPDYPTRAGYSFVGWAKSSTATSALYQPGDAYNEDRNLTLYAVWQQDVVKYSVLYDANGGVSAPATQTKNAGESLKLRTNVPTRTGYTFLGWSTSSTAKTATYQPGDIYTRDVSTTLYAVWKKEETAKQISECRISTDKYYFTYDGSEKSVVIKVYDGSKLLTEGTDYSVSGNGRVNSGECIITISGKGGYTGAKRVSFLIQKAEPTLRFEKESVTITVMDSGKRPNTLKYTTGSEITYTSSNEKIATVDNEGRITYKGLGTVYITATRAESTNYKAKTCSYKLTIENASKLDDSYTVSYNANGGTGAPKEQSYRYGKIAYISKTIPSRPGYSFLGWADSSSSTTVVYKSGATYSGNRDITLYAVWGNKQTTTSYSKVLKFEEIALPFDNLYGKEGTATEKICKIVYKKKDARRFCNSVFNTGYKGNCFGMASTAGLLYAGGKKNKEDKQLSTKYRWGGKGKYISLKNQVIALQAAASSDQNITAMYEKNTTDLAKAVKDDLNNNKVTIVSMHQGESGHSVVAIGFETINSSYDRITIYDVYSWNSDANRKKQYLYLYKNTSGAYDGTWKYVVNGSAKFNHKNKNDDIALTYETYSQYSQLWNKRGTLTFNQ